MNLVRKYQNVLQSLKIGTGSVCLVGLSGGGDSVALLSLCVQVSKIMGLNIHVARVNHGIRDITEDDTEMRYCRKLCDRLQTPYHDLIIPPGHLNRLKSNSGCGPEQAARQLRLTMLKDYAKTVDARYVLLGHTADDQLETILMRIFNGSGPEGLKGIAMQNMPFIRPLLGETRSDLRQYLRDVGVDWMDDSTNSKSDYLRNRIRNELAPLLTDMLPGWKTSLQTLSERSQEVKESLEKFFDTTMPVKWKDNAAIWDTKDWDAAPDYLRALAIWKAFDVLDDSKIPDKRLGWKTLRDGRNKIQNSRFWAVDGIAINRQSDHVMAKKIRNYPEGCNFVLTQNLLDKRFSFGPWTIHVGDQYHPDAVPVDVSQGNWPLSVHIDVWERKSRITVKSICADKDDTKIKNVYILIYDRR